MRDIPHNLLIYPNDSPDELPWVILYMYRDDRLLVAMKKDVVNAGDYPLSVRVLGKDNMKQWGMHFERTGEFMSLHDFVRGCETTKKSPPRIIIEESPRPE